MNQENVSSLAVFLLLVLVSAFAALGYAVGVALVEDHCAHVMGLYGRWTMEQARIVCRGHR